MSVEVTNETEWIIDPKVFSDLGVWVLDQMRVSTQSDLAIMFVDPERRLRSVRRGPCGPCGATRGRGDSAA